MKRTLMMTAAFIFGGHMAFAALTTDTVVTDLTALGYTRIEIKTGPTQMKVEAIRRTEKLEVIYDIESGDILKQEIETVDAGDDIAPGVDISTDDEDFVDGDDDEDDIDEDEDEDEDEDDEDDDEDDEDEDEDEGDDSDDDSDDEDEDEDDSDDDSDSDDEDESDDSDDDSSDS